ncbi:MAG: glycosyltransferase family 2 protein [Lachnospiraceae bacterium]|nr:glycosyltransferase family 2 protein [Lachnospiraceae bacterium]
MKIVSLVSAVDRNIEAMIDGMHLESDAVVVNQCDAEGEKVLNINGNDIRQLDIIGRGVGANRNTCIDNAPECDILLFTDEDIIYDEGYLKKIEDEYNAHSEADVLLFNIRVCEARRTYWNDRFKRIRFYNYGRYPAYSISIRRDALMKSGVKFSTEFGGGAKYANGEDSIFLHELLKSGVKIYATPECLGEETERESSWFNGYNERFFIGRGALYVKLYGAFAKLRALIFLIRHRYMYEELGFGKSYGLMKQGMREIRSMQ